MNHLYKYLESNTHHKPKSNTYDVYKSAQDIEDKGRHNDTILAHFGPEEIEILDYIVGETRKNPHTGLREYSDLEPILFHPDVLPELMSDEPENLEPSMPYGSFSPYQGMHQDNPPVGLSEMQPGFSQHEATMNNQDAGIYGGIHQFPQYAHGGSVHEEARELAHMGQGGDTMLAHITPREAMLFDHMIGGADINPRTGLRQYRKGNEKKKRGFGRIVGAIGSGVKKVGSAFIPFKPARKIFNKAIDSTVKTVAQPGKVPHRLEHNLKNQIPTILSVLGAIYGGPAGAAAGRYIGGRARHETNAQALRGGAKAAAFSYLIPQVGNAFAQSFPGVAGALGNASNSIFGNTATNYLGGALTTPTSFFGGSAFGNTGPAFNIFGGQSGAANPSSIMFQNPASGASGGAGQITREQLASALGLTPAAAPPASTSEGGGGLADLASKLALPALGYLGYRSHKEKKKAATKEKEGTAQNFGISSDFLRRFNSPGVPAKPWKRLDESEYDNPYIYEPSYSGKKKYFGYAEGGISGKGGGQDDKIPAMLSDGEYVIPADIVADIGDGSNKRGAQLFDEFLKNVRRHKASKEKLPPKSRGIAHYLNHKMA